MTVLEILDHQVEGPWDDFLRAAVIYFFTLFLVRIGHRRMLGESSPFDIVLIIMLGSVMSRAINGSATFSATALAGAALVGLHACVAAVTCWSTAAGALFKGSPVEVARDGELNLANLSRMNISKHDFEEALRLAGVPKIEEVCEAYLERNGEISVLRRAHHLETELGGTVERIHVVVER